MITTGVLGSFDSAFGAVELGRLPGILVTASNTLTLSQSASSLISQNSTASNTFVPVQTIIVNAVHTIAVNQTITLAQSGINFYLPGRTSILGIFASGFGQLALGTSSVRTPGGGNIYDRSADSTFSLAQTARGFSGTKFTNQAIMLSELVAVQLIINRSYNHTIVFTQFAGAEKVTPTSNTITFIDSVTVDSTIGTYATFGVTQTVALNITHVERTSNSLNLTQAIVPGASRTKPLSTPITLVQSISVVRVRNLTVSNTLLLVDSAVQAKVQLLTDAFNVDQTISAFTVHNLSVGHSINFEGIVTRSSVVNVSVSNFLDLSTPNTRHTRIIGKKKIVSIPPVIVTKPSKIVTYQVPDSTIVLKRPLLNDTEAGTSTIIKQRAIDGTLFTYVRRTQSRKLKYAFQIPKATKEALRTFILNYLSVPMQMTNWKGEIWIGYIVNNPFEMDSLNRAMPCDRETWHVEIEFEGVRLH